MGEVVKCPRCSIGMSKGSIQSHEILWHGKKAPDNEHIGNKNHNHLGYAVGGQRFQALRCKKCGVITFIYPKDT